MKLMRDDVLKRKKIPIPDNRAADATLPPALRDLADLLADIAIMRLKKTNQQPARGLEKQYEPT